jgi:hypothetical protein
MTDFQSMLNDDVLEWLRRNFDEEVATKCAGEVHLHMYICIQNIDLY